MFKIIPPGSWDFHVPQVQPIKISSRGLRGFDRDEFMKRAGHSIIDQLDNLKLASGEVPVHILALGTTEATGPNRNGDGFRDAVARAYHDTFVKYARYFRNHLNKDPARSYGLVKASCFNEDMKRIELIAALNSTKEAADRNGGLVADLELEKLARGESVPTSMACRVSHDVCSGCGNKAKNRKFYCDESSCMKYGGLRKNIGRTFQDGHTLHADNPDPLFCDISTVPRGADRISFNLGFIEKQAGLFTKCGSALADEQSLTTPTWVWERMGNAWATPEALEQLKVASALLAAEERAWLNPPAPVAAAFGAEVQSPAKAIPDIGRSLEKLSCVISALHHQCCLLPVPEFLRIVTGASTEKVASISDEVAAAVPGAVERLATYDDFEVRLSQNPYLRKAAGVDDYQFAMKHARDWGLQQDRVVERLQRSVIRSVQPKPLLKTASACPSARQLAEEYGLYTLAFLAAQPASQRPQLTELVVQSTRVL